MAILISNLVQGTAHHPTKYQDNSWNPKRVRAVTSSGTDRRTDGPTGGRVEWQYPSAPIAAKGKNCAKTRYVDGTPTPQVTPVTVRYIHPPHHGYPKVIVIINDQLTSLSSHVNQPTHSCNKEISNVDLETWKVKIRGMVKGQDHVQSAQYLIDLLSFRFTAIR